MKRQMIRNREVNFLELGRGSRDAGKQGSRMKGQRRGSKKAQDAVHTWTKSPQ